MTFRFHQGINTLFIRKITSLNLLRTLKLLLYIFLLRPFSRLDQYPWLVEILGQTFQFLFPKQEKAERFFLARTTD
jgi:hypothetical protein